MQFVLLPIIAHILKDDILEKDELKAVPNLNEMLVKKRLERQLRAKNDLEALKKSTLFEKYLRRYFSLPFHSIHK